MNTKHNIFYNLFRNTRITSKTENPSLILINKEGVIQGVFKISKSAPLCQRTIARKKEFLGDRILRKVPKIEHKCVGLITN